MDFCHGTKMRLGGYSWAELEWHQDSQKVAKIRLFVEIRALVYDGCVRHKSDAARLFGLLQWGHQLGPWPPPYSEGETAVFPRKKGQPPGLFAISLVCADVRAQNRIDSGLITRPGVLKKFNHILIEAQ